MRWSQIEHGSACVWRPYLHGVVCVLVVEHQGLLDELMVALQLVNVVLVVDDVVLILLQLVHLVLQGPCDLDGAPGNLLMQQEQGETQVSGSQHPSFGFRCYAHSS